MKKYLFGALLFAALSSLVACQQGKKADESGEQELSLDISIADSSSTSFQNFLNYFKEPKYVFAAHGTRLFRAGEPLNFYRSDTLKTHYGKFLPPQNDCHCYDSLEIYHMPGVRIEAPNYICLSYLRVCEPDNHRCSFIEYILTTYAHQGTMIDYKAFAVADDSTVWAAIESSLSPIHLTLLKEVYKQPQGGVSGNSTCKVSKEEISIDEDGKIQHNVLRQWQDSCYVDLQKDTILLKTPLEKL